MTFFGSTIAENVSKATQFYSVLIYYWCKILFIQKV